MEFLDSTIVVTALPSMAQSLGENPLHLNLAISSYLLAIAVCIPLGGWLADRFGARTVFVGAIMVFTLGSVACGAADSLGQLIVARLLQGCGAAMMSPVGRLIVIRNVPRSELVEAMSYLAVPAMIGPILGPPVGGLIATYTSWRWIFFINVPVGLIGIIAVLKYIDDVREERCPPFDLRGFLVLALALVGIMSGLTTVGRGLLPPALVAALFVAGGVGTGLYLLHARRSSRQILNLGVLRNQIFAIAVFGTSPYRIAVGAVPFLLPLMLQIGFGDTPLQSGLMTFLTTLGAFAMKFTVSPIVRLFGFRRVLIVESVINAAFLAVYALFTPATPWIIMAAVLLFSGFFRSLQFSASVAFAFAEIPLEQTSHATTLLAVERYISSSIGVAVGALSLHLTLGVRGPDAVLQAGDFAPAYLVIALLTLLPTMFYAWLPANAGDEMRGRAVANRASQPEATGAPRG